MPRTPPSTSWGERSSPTTTWITERYGELGWDMTTYTFDTTDLTFDNTLGQNLVTDREDPRYALYVEDLTGSNVDDLTGEEVVGISGYATNKIDTVWD